MSLLSSMSAMFYQSHSTRGTTLRSILTLRVASIMRTFLGFGLLTLAQPELKGRPDRQGQPDPPDPLDPPDPPGQPEPRDPWGRPGHRVIRERRAHRDLRANRGLRELRAA